MADLNFDNLDLDRLQQAKDAELAPKPTAGQPEEIAAQEAQLQQPEKPSSIEDIEVPRLFEGSATAESDPLSEEGKAFEPAALTEKASQISDSIFSTEPTAATAAIQGVGQGISFEFQDELFQVVGDQEAVDRINQTQKEFPMTFGVSRLVGALLSPNPFGKLGAVTKAYKLLKTAGASAKTAKFLANTANIVGLGALFGAGASEEDKRLEGALKTGGTALLIGPAVGLGIKGLSSKTDLVTPVLTRVRAMHGGEAAQVAADQLAKESIKNIVNTSTRVLAGGTAGGLVAEALDQDFVDGFLLGGGFVLGKRSVEPMIGAANRAITKSFGSSAITALEKAKNSARKFHINLTKKAQEFQNRYTNARETARKSKSSLEADLAEAEAIKSQISHTRGILNQADDINTSMSRIGEDAVNSIDDIMINTLNPKQEHIISGISNNNVNITPEVAKAFNGIRSLIGAGKLQDSATKRAEGFINHIKDLTLKQTNPIAGQIRTTNEMNVGRLINVKRDLAEVLYDKNFLQNAPTPVANILRKLERGINSKLNAQDPSGELAKINEGFTNLLNLRSFVQTKMSLPVLESMASNAAKGARAGKSGAESAKNIKLLREMQDYFGTQKKLPDGRNVGFSKEFLEDFKYKSILDSAANKLDSIIRPRVEMKTALNVAEFQAPKMVNRLDRLHSKIDQGASKLPEDRRKILELISERKLTKQVDEVTLRGLELAQREAARNVPINAIDAILGTFSPVRARRFDEAGRAFKRDPFTLGRARRLQEAGQTPLGAAAAQAITQEGVNTLTGGRPILSGQEREFGGGNR